MTYNGSSPTNARAYRLSVVIPTFRDAHCLALTLRSLSSQTLSPELFEVVVVCDGPPDASYDEIANRQHPFAFRFTALPERSGRAAARNEGIRLSDGDVVLSLDADSYADRHLLQHHHEFHARSRTPGVLVGSRYEMEWNQLDHVLRDPGVDASALVGGVVDLRFPGPIGDEAVAECMRTPWLFTFTCNASLPRDVLDLVGGFDTEFGYRWGYEDTDLFYRVYLALERSPEAFRYERAALVCHLPQFRSFRQIRVDEATNATLLRRKHPHLDLELGVYPPTEVAEKLRHYRGVIELCLRLGLGRLPADLPLPPASPGATAGPLVIALGTDPAALPRHATTFDHDRVAEGDNRHLLGTRTPFPDGSMTAVVSADLWRFLRWDELCRFVAESLRLADSLWLCYSEKLADLLPADFRGPVVDDLGYLRDALSTALTVTPHPTADGTVLEVRSR